MRGRQALVYAKVAIAAPGAVLVLYKAATEGKWWFLIGIMMGAGLIYLMFWDAERHL